MNTVLILNNIRSNENVGSIFRTADAAGVSKIYLCGYTPAPIDRFGRKNKALSKSALGAEEFVGWEKLTSLKKLIQRLKEEKMERLGKQKFKIVAVEQSEYSKNYKKIKYPKNVAFVFGNEVTGLSKKDLEMCDEIVEIPMKGKKESLNVAVAVGIVLFR
ncbi:MAG TPA: TrmH family RNA methyltransferase [Candidatus Paceibacterota bacterium]